MLHQRVRGPARILVAEDNYLFAEVVCDFLRDSDLVPVGPAATAAAALKLAASAELDGAVLDVNLGGRLNTSVCERLRARAVPYLFLTAYSDLSRLPAPLRSVPIICKPFDPEEFRRALAGLLMRAAA